MTTRRSSPLSRPGSTDGSSSASSLLVSSGNGGDNRKDGAESFTAPAFAAAFAAECDNDCDDDDDNIGLVSSSVGSLERCIDTINTSLSSWSQESREKLAEIAKNIKEGGTIYWVQGLCANLEKSLALGERGLEVLDRANCPSANFNDRVLKPVAAKLRAKMVFCNIRDLCIRDGVNCMCAMSEEAERMAEVIGVIAKLAHQKKRNSSFRTAVENLSRKR